MEASMLVDTIYNFSLFSVGSPSNLLGKYGLIADKLANIVRLSP